MLKKISLHITQKFPLLPKSHTLLACSGGIDSMVLAHVLLENKFTFSIAHCNFKLRGQESDADEDYVKKWAQINNVPFYTVSFNTKKYAQEHGISTQMAARNLRYSWFYELIDTHGFNYLATAHHLDDDIETFFINLLRGTGLRGLTGIPEINKSIIRPLLPFSKEEIKEFAKQNKITWREDSSNLTDDYLRNKLRHTIIPEIQKINPNFSQNYIKTKQHLQASNHLIEDYISLIYNWAVVQKKGEYYIAIEKIKKLPHAKEVLYALLNPFGFSGWDDIYNLLEAQTGKMVESKEFRILKNRAHLIVSKKIEPESTNLYVIEEDTKEISQPFALTFKTITKAYKLASNSVFIDKSLLKFPLELRKWKHGDYFYPLGMQGKKKLSKYFKDEKLSLFEKENAWVLCSENKIVWVVGYRQDERFKVKETTKEILKIDLK